MAALVAWKRDYLARCWAFELQPLDQIASVVGTTVEALQKYTDGGHDLEFDRICHNYERMRVVQRTGHENWLWGLSDRCKSAIERALEDEKDPHKAADRATAIFYQLMPEQRPSQQNASEDLQLPATTQQDSVVLQAVVAIRDTVKDLRALGEVHDSPHVHVGPSASPRPAIDNQTGMEKTTIEVVQDEIDFSNGA